MRKSFQQFLLTILLLALATACAKQGFPNGGPKDETPPVVIGTEPANGSPYFNAKEFVINFDEYVQVNNAEENILVSPPMKHKPEYGTRGRGIVVKIRDTLLENTTYLFQFKNGIKDFNEGNLLASYEYVFSTGAQIDSMTIHGMVLDAFSEKPVEEAVTVVAYSQEQYEGCPDSLAAKQQPMYMTRCDKDGRFALNNLREGRYYVVALQDGDKNMRLSATEPMAFLDTLVTAVHMPAAPIVKDTSAAKDSAAADSTAALADSVAAQAVANVADSIAAAQDTAVNDSTQLGAKSPSIPDVKLRMSLYKKEVQRITKSGFARKGKIEIVTMLPLSDSLAVTMLDDTTRRPYLLANAHRDTLTLWTTEANCDSIVLRITDTGFCDTLKLQFREKTLTSKKPLKPMAAVTMRSMVQGTHPYYDTLWIAFENPVSHTSLGVGEGTATSDSAVAVLNLTDSTTSYCGLRLGHPCMPSGYTRAMIDFKGKEGEKYQFTVGKGHFVDIYGATNGDSLSITTQYSKAENYGNIALTIQRGVADSAAQPNAALLIVQLTDESSKVVRESVIASDTVLTFSHLKGGKYELRAIVDANGDGQWTAGDYFQLRQPEKVLSFGKTLELRENWDMEETWSINE